jgi:hypothetical protein
MFWYKQAKEGWTEKDYRGDRNEPELFVIWWICFALISLAIVSSMSCLTCGNHLQGYDGSMSGVIIDVSDNDNVTWDATTVTVKSSTESSTYHVFCVNDEKTKKKLIELMGEAYLVKIFYRNNLIMWRWECNGGESIIYDVTTSDLYEEL